MNEIMFSQKESENFYMIEDTRVYNNQFEKKWEQKLSETKVRCSECGKLIIKFKGFEGGCPYCNNHLKNII